MKLPVIRLGHLKVAILLLAYLICVILLGSGPSNAREQPSLKQEQQGAAPQVTPGPTPAVAHPTAGAKRQSCPNFRGQFLYPGDTLVTVKQEGCSKLFLRHQDGTTATLILDGKAHRLQAEAGQS